MLKFLPLLPLASSAAAAQAPAPSAPPSATEIAASLDEHMRRLVPFGYHGALLVARHDSVLIQRGYGSADLQHGRPFTPETPFYIGSLTKQFTAAGILKLEMEGRLRVTDPISRFFDGVPADKQGITLHHLLTHTSGLGVTPGGVDSLRTREQVVRDILADSLRNAPGATYVYSNSGYTLLAAVVERVSGMPYEQYLRDRLWAPAGMARTGYRPPGMRLDEPASGYAGGERVGTPLEVQRLPDGPTWSMRGAGGMVSTLADMLAWSRALDGTAILSADAKARMWTPYVPQNAEGRSHYGYGWVLSRTARGTGLTWHNGGNNIHYAELRRYTDEGVVIIIASNVAEASAEYALPAVARLTFGLPYTAPPAARSADPARAAAAAGRYRLQTGGTLTAIAEDGRLRLEADGWDAHAAVRGAMPSAALDSAGRRTAAMVEAMTRGDVQPMHQAMNGRVPLDALRSMVRQFLEQAEAGAPVGTEVLGVVPARGGGAEVLARVRFERGASLLRVDWRDGVLTGLETMQALPPAVFLPGPDGAWVSYGLQTGETVRVRMEDGALVVETPDGPLRATRAG